MPVINSMSVPYFLKFKSRNNLKNRKYETITKTYIITHRHRQTLINTRTIFVRYRIDKAPL